MMAPSLSSEINDLQELLMGELVPPSQGSLSYPCELTEDGWVNAASGKPLAVRVTYWKPYDIIARIIIDLAITGERDPERLCEAALKAVPVDSNVNAPNPLPSHASPPVLPDS